MPDMGEDPRGVSVREKMLEIANALERERSNVYGRAAGEVLGVVAQVIRQVLNSADEGDMSEIETLRADNRRLKQQLVEAGRVSDELRDIVVKQSQTIQAIRAELAELD